MEYPKPRQGSSSMTELRSFKVRVFYQKTGRLALLSHLEVARSLERAVRRAELPFAVTQGFSPHMKIAFGSALSVGIGGLDECFDLALTEYLKSEDILEPLKQASPSDLMVKSCFPLAPKAPSASVAYPLSTYQVELDTPFEGELVIPETVTIIKKKKEKTLLVQDYLRGDIVVEGYSLTFSLLSKASGSLRVSSFIDALLECQSKSSIVSIMRITQSEE